MQFAVPVYYDSKIVGALFLVCDANFLSNVSNSIKFGTSGVAYIVNDEATTIAHYDGSKTLKQENVIRDFAGNPDFAELIATEKEILSNEFGFSTYHYKGEAKCVGYAKVPDSSWHVVVTIPASELNAGATTMKRGILIISAIVVVVACAVGVLVANQIVKPIINIEKELGRIASGDLTKEIPKSLLNIQDETGKLARELSKMQDSFKDALKKVHTEVQQVVNFSGQQSIQVDALQSNVESVSATTQQLSASSQEMAASAAEMTTTANDAQAAVESIASRAQDGARTADEIRQRATQLENSTIESQKVATNMYKQSMAILTKAIEDSKRVDEINQLSDAILGITSQTNLLALNASIEAARAGDAGKGFAVVATEIGKLADDSQQSASQIKAVTEGVIASVENLSNGAQDILKFIDSIVMNDYKKMVETSRQYNNDAVQIDDVISDLSATSEELFATISNIAERLTEVSRVTEEFAQGTSSIASSTMDIAQKTDNVALSVADTKGSTGNLSQAVAVFSI